MAFGTHERLVGWRYLFRQESRPRPLIIGIDMIALGALLVWIALSGLEAEGQSVQVVGMAPGMERNLLIVGGIIGGVGACITLFGTLYYRMTVFSAFSTFMVAIGVAEVILVLGVMSGLHSDLRNNIINASAHVQIEPATAGEWISDYEEMTEVVRNTEGVSGASPMLRTEVILSGTHNPRPAILMGIQSETIEEANRLPEQVVVGCLERLDTPERPCEHWLLREPESASKSEKDSGSPSATPSERLADPSLGEMAIPLPPEGGPPPRPTLLVGTELYKNLYFTDLRPLNVISPFGDLGPSGPIPRSRPFEVAGTFATKMLQYDESYAYASLSSVQTFLGVGDVVNSIQIRVDTLEEARLVRDRLREKIPGDLIVTDWQDRNQNLFAALKLERIVMFLVLTINILLAAFSITGTLVMTIIERRREIAILMAMGASQPSILRVFLSQGLFTGVVGSLAGTAIGVGLGLALSNLGLPLNTEVYYIDAIPVDIRLENVLAIIGVAILVSMLSTIYPARFAARLKPVEGLSAE